MTTEPLPAIEPVTDEDVMVARLTAANGWRPIETAPKDGTWFLAISAGEHKWTGAKFRPVIVAITPEGDYIADDISDEFVEFEPSELPLTHWMPLPKEPTP